MYRWLAGAQHLEAATLFLYTLIHQNSNVKAYILSRMDLDTIVMRKREIKIEILFLVKRDLLFLDTQGFEVDTPVQKS